MTLLADMLLADSPPENVVVGEGAPTCTDLGCTAQRGRIDVGEDLERDFTRQNEEGVDAD